MKLKIDKSEIENMSSKIVSYDKGINVCEIELCFNCFFIVLLSVRLDQFCNCGLYEVLSERIDAPYETFERIASTMKYGLKCYLECLKEDENKIQK